MKILISIIIHIIYIKIININFIIININIIKISIINIINININAIDNITHHHHYVVSPARISLTLSRHFFHSFLTGLQGYVPYPHIACCMYVRAGRPAFARPYAGVHRSTSLMSLSLRLQQCPVCQVRLTWIVFVMGGRWPYSLCFVGCCLQDLFSIARSILM